MTANPTGPGPNQRVEIVGELEAPGRLWNPAVGDETEALLVRLANRIPDEERTRARDEALNVLARCVPPTGAEARSETGLAIGYVQSGKTLSFTLLATLARDNGFRVIIVITGTSRPLFTQSTNRLTEDLDLNGRADQRWLLFPNPRPRTDRQCVEATIRDWSDPLVHERDRRCMLVTVMKNGTHLDNLTRLLSGIDLSQVGALIIDDEADQASLNNQVRQQTESATYRRLRSLRRLFPRHSYLQYTATPQAPLLINVIDVLSPSFAAVLTPGAGYLGGRDIFLTTGQPLVRIIPGAEIPGPNNVLTGPPNSLIEAIRSFVIGVAAHLAGDRGGIRNRSMMVHPSRETAFHADYVLWVNAIRDRWARTLEAADGTPDRDSLLGEFRSTYDGVARTAPSVPGFDTIAQHLRRALGQIRITEINRRRQNATSGATPQVDWRRDPFHILVGGQALDRGFTVEGLTVTYMPRGVGMGNADTVQQRARFFGYKRAYEGYCRIFVGVDVASAFVAYAEHEEDIRDRVRQHAATGRPLMAWKRAFFLHPSLRPTRDSVLDVLYRRGNFSDDWFEPRAPHTVPEAVEANRQVVRDYLATLALVADEGHAQRTAMQVHRVASDRLARAFDELLIRIRQPYAADSQEFTGLLLQVQDYLERNPDASCTIFEMSPGAERVRSTGARDEILQLFQGPYPDRAGAVYPGDRQIRAQDELTIQIHRLSVQSSAGPPIQDVPTIAVWVPRAMARGWLNQDQGGS